ncbi:MAG: glycosyltransferase [Actinomycetota bacterium]|nr:glycosyltransferase [Actinomycetota bacterium]
MTETGPRVLHVLEALEGGTARHVIDIVRHARGSVHEVAVPEERRGGLTDRTAIAQFEAAGAVVHLVPLRRTPWTPGNLVSLARVRRLVSRRDPDVIHTHSSIGGLVGRVAVVGRHVPRVYTPNGITHVRIGRTMERVLGRLTDRFVAVSTSEAELATSLGLIDASKLVVIPNGVEPTGPEPIDLRGQFGLGPDTPLVGTVARLVPQKAPLDLVAAWAIVAAARPDVRFVWIGGGELAAEFDAAVAAAALTERLVRIDELPGAAGALGDLDLFTLASIFEGGPYAPLEAMRANTAVVLTDVVGSRDAVVDGESGVLVPAGRPDALAAAVIALLDDPERRHAIAASGAQRVADEFTVTRMGQRLDDLYLELTTRRHGGARGPARDRRGR